MIGITGCWLPGRTDRRAACRALEEAGAEDQQNRQVLPTSERSIAIVGSKHHRWHRMALVLLAGVASTAGLVVLFERDPLSSARFTSALFLLAVGVIAATWAGMAEARRVLGEMDSERH